MTIPDYRLTLHSSPNSHAIRGLRLKRLPASQVE
jgi:hypothetical protein